MPRYALRIHGAPVAAQQSGSDFPDLAAAMAWGNRHVSRIVAQRAIAGKPLTGSLDIEDERGWLVAKILFADVARGMARPGST